MVQIGRNGGEQCGSEQCQRERSRAPPGSDHHDGDGEEQDREFHRRALAQAPYSRRARIVCWRQPVDSKVGRAKHRLQPVRRNMLRRNVQLGDGNDERDAQTDPADDPGNAVGEIDTHTMAEENGS